MMSKLFSTTILAAVFAATMGTTAAQAQDWRSDYSYEWGASDGYRGGWRDGYEGGSSDGYRRGWRDADEYNEYNEYRDYRSRDDDDRAYYHRQRCKRSSGTGGLIIGGVAGGLLGREIARDRTAGALLGGGAGALAGRALERGQSRC